MLVSSEKKTEVTVHTGYQNCQQKTERVWPGLMQHSAVRVRIWWKQHKSMALTFFVSVVQTRGGVIVPWDIFCGKLWPLQTSSVWLCGSSSAFKVIQPSLIRRSLCGLV